MAVREGKVRDLGEVKLTTGGREGEGGDKGKTRTGEEKAMYGIGKAGMN